MKKICLLASVAVTLTACQTIELYPKDSGPAQIYQYDAIQSATATSTFGIYLANEKAVGSFTQEFDVNGSSYYVDPNTQITRDDLEDVVAKEDNDKRLAWVILTLNDQGARKLANLTQYNQGKYLSVNIKNQVVALLNINQTLSKTLIVPMSSSYQASTFEQQIMDGD